MKLHINVYSDGRVDGGNVPVVVHALDESNDDLQTVVPFGPLGRELDVKSGRYLVEAVLPSGERLRATTTVEKSSGATVHLSPSASPHEWLTLQNLLVPKRRLLSAAFDRDDAFDAGTTEPPRVYLLEQWPQEWCGRGLGDLVTAGKNLRSDAENGVEPNNDDGTVFHFSIAPDETREGLAAVVVGMPGTTLVAPLVRNWRTQDGSFASTELVVNVERQSLSIAIEDPQFAPVLAYLASGDSARAAASLGQVSLELLIDKLRNPCAAAAGAYVLLDSLHDGSRAPHWRQWISNLAKWFKWLPDGALLEGQALLHTDDLAGALDLFLEAFERGVPCFSAGLRILSAAMMSFSGDERSGAAAELELATQHVRRWANWLDPREGFTTLRLPLEVEERRPRPMLAGAGG